MAYGIETLFLLSYCLGCCWPIIVAKGGLALVEQWAALDFIFPSEAARQTAIAKRFYIPGNSVAIDVDVNYKTSNKSRLFVTVPRFDEGRPVILGTVDEDGLINGYPDYSWHDNQGSNCDGLTSVFRVAVCDTDKCNRLWAMDSGKVGKNRVCSPQLLAFDLNTDKLLYRHRPNNSSYRATSRLFLSFYF